MTKHIGATRDHKDILLIEEGRKARLMLTFSGFFPRDMNTAMEELISGAVNTTLENCDFSEEQLSNPRALVMLRELIEMELEVFVEEHEHLIRYTRVTNDKTSVLIEVHLEEASAPCKTNFTMRFMNADD